MLLAALAALGFRWLQAPNREGRSVMDQIDGFKQYLSVAEEDRLEFLNPPKKTPELFERFLPYAIALTSRTAGPTASPACWRRRASAPRCRPGTSAANSAPSVQVSFTERVSDNLSQHHFIGVDAAGIERRQRWRRFQWRLERRRLFGRRRRRGRRVRLVMPDGEQLCRLSSGECRAQGVRCDVINGTGSGYSLMVRTLTGLLPGIASPLLSNALAVMVPAHPTFR